MSSEKSQTRYFNEDFSARIKSIRGDLDQKEFAKAIGVGQSAVSNYEKGRIPRAAILQKIAEYGNTTVEWLLRGDQKAIEEPGEPITIESPARPSPLHEPFIFGGIDIGAMAQIIEAVDELLSKRKKPLKSSKKAFLIALLYDEFQKTGQPLTQATLKEFLRRVE